MWNKNRICGGIHGRSGFSDISTVDEYANQCKEHAAFLDTTLALFKGELSLTDILTLPFRRLLELRTARIDRLIEERKSEEEKMKDQQQQQIRNRILEK